MNDPTPLPPPPPPVATPVEPPDRRGPRRPPKAGIGCLLPVVLIALFASLLANVLLGFFVASGVSASFDSDSALEEKFFLGDRDASDKVAVVRVEGVISDSGIAFPVKQLEVAARDKRVKAVVLRVDSPGGTVTASEELYQCAVNLRDNTGRRFAGTGPKPLSVSMGGVAASGGYYVAMAGKPVAAEPTTITGSIGVFAALPNVAGLGEKYGVKVALIKAGAIKASGSFFHNMEPEERQTWQDTVDSAYEVFLDRIAAGRPGLSKEKLRSEVVIDRQIPKRNDKGDPVDAEGKVVGPMGAAELVRYTRVRADGGTFTAEQARQFGLVDGVEDLPASIRAAAAAAGLSKFKAVTYHRPPGLMDLLISGGADSKQALPDAKGLANALTPRLWYLAPTADGAILTP